MSAIVVLAVVLATDLMALTDPAFIAALATLVASITGLVLALRAQTTANATHQHVTDNSATLKTVERRTNGEMDSLRGQVFELRKQADAHGLPILPAVQAEIGATGSSGS